MEQLLLAGKAFVVTGAASGLGRAYALEIARNGGDLVLNDVDTAALDRTASEVRAVHSRVLSIAGSVSEWNVAAELSLACQREFGVVNGLVNNAGVLHVSAPWEETEATLRRTIEVNVLGSWFCGVHALTQMNAQGFGSIVNITSGVLSGWPGLSAYGTSKAAVAGMTAGWAHEVAGSAVRVNAVMPVASTAMSSGAAEWIRQTGVRTVEHQPPDRIAPLVAFLLSDRAGKINGRILRHDGYTLAHVPWPGGAASSVVEVQPEARSSDYERLVCALLDSDASQHPVLTSSG